MSEKLQILNMVKDGTITAEEGADLLEALDSTKEITSLENKSNASFLKVRVISPEDDTKVNVTLPIGLIKSGLKLAMKIAPEFKDSGLSDDDINDILLAVEDGQVGKIVDVDSGDGTKVEVVIE